MRFSTCPACGHTHMSTDERAQNWRVRIRLYTGDMKDPEADTDPELPADKPGALIIAGLPAVAVYLAEVAMNAHNGHAIQGLELDTLRHRLKSLRPTLSRRGGDATWRVPYQVKDFADGWIAWLARVDVERVDN